MAGHDQKKTYEEKLHVSPEEPKPVISRTAPRGRMRSRAGWASKERSTPEDMNLEQHAFRFQLPFPQDKADTSYGDFSSDSDPEPPVPRKKKSPEERNAIREERIAQRKRATQFHAQLALRKYNRANNTKFELVEVRARCFFFEFGGGCYHYNFTAKPEEGHRSNDDDSVKLFFSEVNYCPRNENDVLHCCIVGENDAGHCYACRGDYPTLIHPTSRAYGGGNTTCIDLPSSDISSSDSD